MRQIVNARREAGGESCSVLYADTGEDSQISRQSRSKIGNNQLT